MKINVDSFINKDEILQKALEDIFEKGKRATIGEERTWGGEKYRKEVDGWVKVSDGSKHTKKDEDEVDAKDTKERVKERVTERDGLQENILKNVVENNVYASQREGHTKDSLTHSVKSILASKGTIGEKTINLFQQGLHLHEIVNLANTSLSAAVDTLARAMKEGKLDNESNPPSAIEEKTESPKANRNNKTEAEADLSDLVSWLDELGPIDYKTAWNTYKNMINQTALGISKGGFFYGTGGVGKTYTMKKQLEALNMRKGNVVIAQETENSTGETSDAALIDDFSEDSIYGKDEQTGRTYIKKDKYDYITITGKVSPVKMFQLMQEHNGKIIVFDDCDEMLKSSDAVNLLKGALDTGEAEAISWNTSGIPKSDFAGIKGAKAIQDKNGNVTHYELPKSFTFTGQVMWISNLPKDRVPQPLKSRCDMVDLTMTRQETIDKIEQDILPSAEFYEKDGKTKFTVKDESKQLALGFMKKIINALPIDDLNGRTFIKTARYIDTNNQGGVPLKETYQQLAQMYVPDLLKRKS